MFTLLVCIIWSIVHAIISNNTDYHLKKNCKLHTDIFIIILIITFATIIILQKQLYFNLSITVEPPLSCHPQGTGISSHLMEVGPLDRGSS